MTDSLNTKVQRAAKWSLLTELIARIATPVIQLVLARILTPGAFGIVATVVMISSFAEMISDAGFQKYLIQHEFKSRALLEKNACVAFWSSMTIATILLALIAVFREPLSALVGNPGLGLPIVVASFSLPLSVCVSIQQSLFRREFEYKKLMPIRVSVALLPLVVTVPLALAGLGYWAMIIGTLSATLLNAVLLTILSPWKPRFYFSFDLLREMLSFSIWTLIEAITIWFSVWAGTFIVGSLLTPHELGLYRQPMTTVNAMYALITSATTPILFAALSRLQSNAADFRKFFLRFQLIIAVFVLPIGVGAFCYRDFFVTLLFGDQWSEASLMFGSWALSTAFAIIFSHYCSEIYRALGKPRVSILAQVLYMAAMIPSVYFAALQGFTTLVVVNSAIRIVMIVINQVLVFIVAHISLLQVLKNLYAPLIAVLGMGLVAGLAAQAASGNALWCLVGILGCAALYVSLCLCFRNTRTVLFEYVFHRGVGVDVRE